LRPPTESGLSDPALARTLREIHLDVARRWTVEQIARTALATPNAFEKTTLFDRTIASDNPGTRCRCICVVTNDSIDLAWASESGWATAGKGETTAATMTAIKKRRIVSSLAAAPERRGAWFSGGLANDSKAPLAKIGLVPEFYLPGYTPANADLTRRCNSVS
jgi:hypothetical protein